LILNGMLGLMLFWIGWQRLLKMVERKQVIWRKIVKLLTSNLKLLPLSWKRWRQSWNGLRRRRNRSLRFK
jgi:hypothetical protein